MENQLFKKFRKIKYLHQSQPVESMMPWKLTSMTLDVQPFRNMITFLKKFIKRAKKYLGMDHPLLLLLPLKQQLDTFNTLPRYRYGSLLEIAKIRELSISEELAQVMMRDQELYVPTIKLPNDHVTEFNDALKEGDGDRLFELYKLALLLYKTHGHYKYAYGVLLYLVKCIAVLPPSHALQLKWNRTYNVSGLPGRNITLDLQKEHDNKNVKCKWRNLRANLDEQNAEKTAGTLQSTQLVYQSITEIAW
ncbi:hypothetical protein ACROYT_G014696 [Oculina patagonica]